MFLFQMLLYLLRQDTIIVLIEGEFSWLRREPTPNPSQEGNK